MRAQFRWAVGILLVRPMGNGLWGVRTKLPDNRIARVFLSFVQGRLIALHGFIKKTQQTPDAELRLPRKRKTIKSVSSGVSETFWATPRGMRPLSQSGSAIGSL